MVAEWEPLFRRRVIQPGFFCSFLLQCKMPPTFLYIAAVSDSHSHQLLGHLRPNTSVPALYAHFLELWQSAQSVPSSRFRAQILFTGRFGHGFFCAFLLQCVVPPTCLWCSVCQHSDQLLRTLHSTHPFLHCMLIFCSFCCLPSQSQRSDSLLRFCLEALFGAQSRVALPRRGCFQAILSGCTILPIISCSSFALSKYLQMAVNMDGPWCTQGGMLVLYLFGMSKNPRHFSLSPQGRRLVHHLHSGMFRRHQVGYIIFTYCSVYCNGTFYKCSAICSGLVGILYRSLLCALFFRVRSGMWMIRPAGCP